MIEEETKERLIAPEEQKRNASSVHDIVSRLLYKLLTIKFVIVG